MARPLTEEQRDIRKLRTALRQADTAVAQLLDMHTYDEAGGLKA